MEEEKKLKVLISEEELNDRIKELANQIYEDYHGQEITFICILKGSIFFTVGQKRKKSMRNGSRLCRIWYPR